MALLFANVGEQGSIKKIAGNENSRKFLETLGFVTGSFVTVITKSGGNIIVSIKESRIAISREMASKIYI
ncbi:hypothetical protein FACS189425_06060 [Clostridia bacterium]|nr:hypothetical protein FACS189425_06060 [Clostridia bacterium]